MTDFTRVTVVGSQRRAVVVVPNDETLGTLVPQLMDLLDEPGALVARPLTLVRLTGERLDPDRSPAELAVADGELLHLVRLDEAPPPPEVSDVTDAVSESMAGRAGRWDARSRLAAGTTAVGLLVGGSALEALVAGPPVALLPPALLATALVAALALGLGRLERPHRIALAIALGVVPAVVLGVLAPLSLVGGPVERVAVTLCCLAGSTWAVLLIGWGVAARRAPATLGSAAGLVGSALPLGLLAVGLPVGRAAAVTAVAAVVAVGLVPAYATTAPGLTAIDDRVIAGRLTGRDEVLRTLDGAYRSLTWTTVAVAVVLGLGLVGSVLAPDPWLTGAAAAVAVVAALRTRAFPLRVPVLALWGAVGAGYVAAAVALLPPLQAAGAGLGAALVVTALAQTEPAPHRRAALRRVGTVVETIAVVALVPLLIGAFGVYGELLAAFR